MRKGDTGKEVAQLQRLLNSVGLSVVADGWYGDTTTAAVAAFQQRAPLWHTRADLQEGSR